MNTAKWIDYFKSNRKEVKVDWKAPINLPEEQRRRVVESLAVFQLGETGEGGTLRRYAVKSRAWPGFEGYEEALDLFVREENRHADLLASMVRRLGGQLLEVQWTNSVFRVLRKPLNLQFELQILLTAELIAEAYYELLRRTLGDEPLRRCCARIVKDEVGHTRFHSEFFGEVQRRWPRYLRGLWVWQFLAIHWLVCQVVWWDHRKCFQALGIVCGEYQWLCKRARRTFLSRVRRIAESERNGEILQRSAALPR